ncbi:hypothetical protein [Burkholderia glumae]|uniref:hypothetical protein n=1 Tax=Burkholderia glumae TaxID=337 RepID=UPI000F5F8458|nr:hypothetical protein [Burkholderia glumae]
MRSSIPRVALLLAVLLKRSGKTRVRVSEKTYRLISDRTVLRDAFLVDVRRELEDLGVLCVRLERGGFALIAISALEGAPSATARNLLPNRRALSDDDLWDELGMSGDDQEENDDQV